MASFKHARLDDYGMPLGVCPLGPTKHGTSMIGSQTRDTSSTKALLHLCTHYGHTFHGSMEDHTWEMFLDMRLVRFVNDVGSLSIYLIVQFTIII